MTISKLLTLITTQLTSHYECQETAHQIALFLLQKATKKTATELLVSPEMDQKIGNVVQQWVDLIIKDHMPVQYILESVPFLNVDITVQPPILIPRPETEEWCQELITYLATQMDSTSLTTSGQPSPLTLSLSKGREFKALDLCSGTGCIALALAKTFPRAQITASDINIQACDLIKVNRQNNNISNCIVIQSDLFEDITGKYSIITANPPYISYAEWQQLNLNIKNWESPQALIAEHDGYAIIEHIISQARNHLDTRHPNALWIEIGATQGQRVARCFEKAGYHDIKILKDLQKKDRVVKGSI